MFCTCFCQFCTIENKLNLRVVTVCQNNNISNRALVASCGKINTNRASIANSGKAIINRASFSCYKSGPFQLLQVGTKLLQTGAVITNWSNYFKSVQNTKHDSYSKLYLLFSLANAHLANDIFDECNLKHN